MGTENSPALTTLVVILGASEWPEYEELNNGEPSAFAQSAKDIEAYFLDKDRFGLPPKNLRNLFDESISADAIDIEIGRFIDDRTAELKTSGYTFKNLLVYFVGHAGFDEHNDYYLAIRRTREVNPGASSIRIATLGVTLRKKARSLRRVIILDCCFAAAAFRYLQAAKPEDVALQKAQDAFTDRSGETRKGTSLLCSSSHKDASISISHNKKHTMFSGALLHALEGDNRLRHDYLSLQTIARLIKTYLQSHYLNDDSKPVPMPQVISPDQSEGEDIAEVELFPNLAIKTLETTQGAIRKFGEIEDGRTQCCVIVSETGEKNQQGESLKAIVERMLKGYAKKIEEKTKKSLNKEPYVINISKIVSSKEMYENAILALCRSGIAIFDVTNYEPAVMLFLGIRSVVRRGVTILTTDIDITNEKHFEAPFNIKEVNVISHAERAHERDDPMHPMGSRVVEGLEQLSRLPHYLDLPSFDAIRTLPPDPESQIPKDYTEQVLILCPFGKEYQKNNWQRHIKRNLGLQIQDSVGQETQPDLVRTLDMKSPRLVSQMLYETIRLTSMCIVDWTAWRPNVLFEMGVRLAASETGPICIIEEQHENFIRTAVNRKEELNSISKPKGFSENDYLRLTSSASQCIQLLALFEPIVYKASEGDADRKAYERMVLHYQEVVKYVNNKDEDLKKDQEWEEQTKTLPPDYTYKTISNFIDLEVEIATKTVYTELIESANRLSGRDRERSPVLYQHADLKKKSEEGADERRLAAWYYLNGRYGLNELVSDDELARTYIDLGNQLSATLFASSESKHKSLAQTIRDQVKNFKTLISKRGDDNAVT